MKKSILYLCALCFLFASPCTAKATLINVSSGLVYDNTTGKYWDRNIGQAQTILEAFNWIRQSPYGLVTWHLASLREITDLVSGTNPSEFLNSFVATGIEPRDHEGWFPDVENRNDKYFVGATNDWDYSPELNYFEPLLICSVFVDFASTDLQQVTPTGFRIEPSDGPQYQSSSELGVWLTASGPAPVLLAVPEPSTIFLLGAGLGLVALLRNRKRPLP